MIMLFQCKNNHSFEVSEEKLRQEGIVMRYCPYCGEKLSIVNIDDVVASDLKKQIADKITLWIKEMGGDEMLSMVERNIKHFPDKTQELYRAELKGRGFIINW